VGCPAAIRYERQADADVRPDQATLPLDGKRARLLTINLRGLDAVITPEGPLGAEADRLAPVLRSVVDLGVRRLIFDLSLVTDIPPGLPELLTSVGRTLLDRGGWLIADGQDLTLNLVEPPLDEVFRTYREAAGGSPDVSGG
jgi:hypothetical protein